MTVSSASSGTGQPGAEGQIVLDKYLDALAVGDLDAIAGSFAEGAISTRPASGIRYQRATCAGC